MTIEEAELGFEMFRDKWVISTDYYLFLEEQLAGADCLFQMHLKPLNLLRGG